MMELSNNRTGEGQLVLCMMVHFTQNESETPIYGVSINPENVRKLKKPIAMNVM